MGIDKIWIRRIMKKTRYSEIFMGFYSICNANKQGIHMMKSDYFKVY